MMCIFSFVVMLPLKHTTVTLNLAFLNVLEALTDSIFLQMFRLEDMKAEESAMWMMTFVDKNQEQHIE